MRHVLVVFALAAIVAAALAASAAASGPVPPGKLKQGNVFVASCGGDVDTVTLAANHGSGAAQFADRGGHIIPVSFEFVVADVTTPATLQDDFSAQGKGNAHPNQSTIDCRIVVFDGSATEAFGSDLPPGVSADDEILATLDVVAIPKT